MKSAIQIALLTFLIAAVTFAGSGSAVKTDLAARVARLEAQQDMLPRVTHEASGAVGLLVGEYIWTDPSGQRALRYQNEKDQKGNPLVAFDGNGPFVVREFQGSAFLINEKQIVTSNFILAPWSGDPLLDESENPEVTPNIRALQVFFPGASAGFDVQIDRSNEANDTVFCSIKEGKLQASPLHVAQQKANLGDPVVTLGYPGGVGVLLSRVPEDVRREVYKFGESSLMETARVLAEHGYIQPIASTVRISGKTQSRLFFEGFESWGNTGSPLLDASGRVVAINQATHPDYPGFNMATTID